MQKWPDRTFLESSKRRPSRKTAGVMWASALAKASAKEKIYAKNLAGNAISLKITVSQGQPKFQVLAKFLE